MNYLNNADDTVPAAGSHSLLKVAAAGGQSTRSQE